MRVIIMSRPRRVIENNTTYHTYTRCINKENLLQKSLFKDILIIAIEETQKLYEFDLHFFEIMPNHIHLVITTRNKDHTISKIMQRIKSVTARRYNKLVMRCGPFWNERFCSRLVYAFVDLCYYIGYNPVKAGLVDDPSEYEYSSYNCYISFSFKSKLKIIHHEDYLRLADSPKDRVKKFMELQKSYHTKYSKDYLLIKR